MPIGDGLGLQTADAAWARAPGCHTGRVEQPGGVQRGDRFYRAGAMIVLVAMLIDFMTDPSWLIGGVLTAYALFFAWAWRERRRRQAGQ